VKDLGMGRNGPDTAYQRDMVERESLNYQVWKWMRMMNDRNGDGEVSGKAV